MIADLGWAVRLGAIFVNAASLVGDETCSKMFWSTLCLILRTALT